MTSGEWTCLISFATAPLTCSERGGSEKFKMKYRSAAGFEPHNASPRQETQRLRPLGHEGLVVISAWFNVLQDNGIHISKNLRDNTCQLDNRYMCI